MLSVLWESCVSYMAVLFVSSRSLVKMAVAGVAQAFCGG